MFAQLEVEAKAATRNVRDCAVITASQAEDADIILGALEVEEYDFVTYLAKRIISGWRRKPRHRIRASPKSNPTKLESSLLRAF